MELEYGAHSITGLRHMANEDSYRLLGNTINLVKAAERGQLFAVFDGMGSAPRGGEAANFMSNSLLDFFRSNRFENSAIGIKELLLQANLELFCWGQDERARRPEGACAGTLAWFNEKNVTIFHAGDTFGLLLRVDQHDNQYENLTTSQGIGNGIFSYFGIGENILLEIKQIQAEEGDIVVLCSDGIADNRAVSCSLVAEVVRKNILYSPERAANELCRLAKLRGSVDDITAVVIEVIDFE